MSAKLPLHALLLTLVSLGVLGFAYYRVNFGIPLWLFGPLLGWALSLGLPTTLAVHGLAWFWDGWPLWVFCGLALLLSFTLQLGLLVLFEGLRRRRRTA